MFNMTIWQAKGHWIVSSRRFGAVSGRAYYLMKHLEPPNVATTRSKRVAKEAFVNTEKESVCVDINAATLFCSKAGNFPTVLE